MIRCNYTTRSGQMTFEFDAADAKDLFAQRAMVELHDEECCGMCQNTHIRCEVRTTREGHVYYEMRCQNRAPNARLTFGQNKDMKSLFVKRSEHPEANGWHIYQADDREHEEASQRTGPSNTNGAGPKTPTQARREDAGAAATPAVPPASSSPPDAHIRTLSALDAANTVENADAWLAWGTRAARTGIQKAEQEAAHKVALERIRNAKAIPPVRR